MLKWQWFTTSFSPYSPGWYLQNEVEIFTLVIYGSNLSGISGYRDWKYCVVSSDYLGFRLRLMKIRAAQKITYGQGAWVTVVPTLLVFYSILFYSRLWLLPSEMFSNVCLSILPTSNQTCAVSSLTLGLQSTALPADINGMVMMRNWSGQPWPDSRNCVGVAGDREDSYKLPWETGRKITNLSELLSVIQPTLQQDTSYIEVYRALLLYQIARSLKTATA